MENKTINVTQSKINNIHSYGNINKERPVRNITLNFSAGASYFKGRLEILKNIRELFTSNRNKIIVIHGAPGFGKTETARQFAVNNSNYYKGNLIWIFAETQDSVKKCFSNLARILNLRTTDVSHIYGKFKSTPCLIIFDNVENMKSIREYLPLCRLHSTINILITSQFSQWDSSIYKIPLEPLNLEDSLQIFEAKLGDEYKKYVIKIWEDLANYLERIPLSLQIVSSLLKDEFNKVHIATFNLEIFINDLKERFINSEISASEINNYKATVFSSIRFALKRLKKEDTCHALELLRFIAYLDADFIYPRALLFLPSVNKSEEKLERALTKLVHYSLIQEERDYKNRLKIKIHRTIQLVLRKYDLNEQNGSMFKTALKTTLSYKMVFHSNSVFKYVRDKEFKCKSLEFYNENKNLVNAYFLELASFHCDGVLQKLLPKFVEEYSETELIINKMLQKAIYFKNADIFTIDLLIKKYGAKIDTNIFHLASSWMSIELFDCLLKSNSHKSIIDSKDYEGKTILHQLVEKCNKDNLKNTIQCMDHLIYKWDAKISIRNYKNETLLHIACRTNNAQIKLIKYLIEKCKCKKFVNTQNYGGRTPLQHLFEYNYDNPELFEIASYFLNNCKIDLIITDFRYWNLLFYICRYGTSKIIDFVFKTINCRKFINNQDLHGNVAFTLLIYNESIKEEREKMELINVFIDNEMDFNVRNKEGKTLANIAKKENLIKLSHQLRGQTTLA